MNDDMAIEIDEVSKKYCKSLKDSMFYGMADIFRNICGVSSKPHKLREKEFWAVDDVSFAIEKGETIGLIGPNGSGKTTLLKMINGIFWPDKGKISVKGRVGALIAVGAGFHPMLTGRENIYVNAAILGMNKYDIDKKLDSIIEFADIADFLDSPVKNYSSGMYVRLGFSVAVHCEPDILLVDEVLAVGDIAFQVKCYQKMYEIKKRGTTIILVTHNIATIREQTSKCLYLNHGKIKHYGLSDDATDLYLKDIMEQKSKNLDKSQVYGLDFNKARIMSLNFYERSWDKISNVESGDTLNAVIECEIKKPLNNVIFGLNFYNDRGFQYCANSFYEDVFFGDLLPGKYSITIHFPNFYLPYNSYLCSVVIALEHPENLLDWHNKAYRLIVTKAKKSRGSIKIPTKWEFRKVSNCMELQNI